MVETRSPVRSDPDCRRGNRSQEKRWCNWGALRRLEVRAVRSFAPASADAKLSRRILVRTKGKGCDIGYAPADNSCEGVLPRGHMYRRSPRCDHRFRGPNATHLSQGRTAAWVPDESPRRSKSPSLLRTGKSIRFANPFDRRRAPYYKRSFECQDARSVQMPDFPGPGEDVAICHEMRRLGRERWVSSRSIHRIFTLDARFDCAHCGS